MMLDACAFQKTCGGGSYSTKTHMLVAKAETSMHICAV